MTTPRFEEHQRFTQLWLWVPMLLLAALFTWGFVQQVVLGKPWGLSGELSDTLVWVLFLSGIGIPLFIGSLRLDTVVTEAELRVRLWPLPGRRIPTTSIRRCEARRYRPILEYGGWGVRYGLRHGWAYNVKGNQGVQLELEGAKPLLIGSQQSAALEAAINAARRA